jgi:hypothetical protein
VTPDDIGLSLEAAVTDAGLLYLGFVLLPGWPLQPRSMRVAIWMARGVGIIGSLANIWFVWHRLH